MPGAAGVLLAWLLSGGLGGGEALQRGLFQKHQQRGTVEARILDRIFYLDRMSRAYSLILPGTAFGLCQWGKALNWMLLSTISQLVVVCVCGGGVPSLPH